MLRAVKSPSLPAVWAACLLLCVTSSAALAQSAGVYEIDPDASEIHWRIYKAGAFARFGHNHVIAVAQPSGTVTVADDMADSTVAIEFPVAELSVDDPQLRTRYGEDFASEPSAEDLAGTRANMLTAQVLNGEAFPAITLTGTALSGSGADQMIELTVAILGRMINLSVPVTVSFSENMLRAQAEFRLVHEDLGMEPFSVMMGALQVAPEIDFTVDITAIMRGTAIVL